MMHQKRLRNLLQPLAQIALRVNTDSFFPTCVRFRYYLSEYKLPFFLLLPILKMQSFNHGLEEEYLV